MAPPMCRQDCWATKAMIIGWQPCLALAFCGCLPPSVRSTWEHPHGYSSHGTQPKVMTQGLRITWSAPKDANICQPPSNTINKPSLSYKFAGKSPAKLAVKLMSIHTDLPGASGAKPGAPLAGGHSAAGRRGARTPGRCWLGGTQPGSVP